MSRQRGVALMFGIMLLALLSALAAALDIGRLYNAQRTLQKQASMAALDAARVISRCNTNMQPTAGELLASVQTSLSRNGVTAPDTEFTAWGVEHGIVIIDGGTHFRRLLPGVIDEADAVRVTLRRVPPDPLLPFLRTANGQVISASATATQTALGNLRVGSTLVGIQDGVVDALLSGLLGGDIAIGALGYEGLLGVNLTLEQLGLALGLTVQDLSDPLVLSAVTPIFSDVLDNLIDTLDGQVSTEVINALRELAGETTNNSPIPLGDVLSPVGEAAAEVPFVNLGEMLIALAMATQADAGGGLAAIPLPISLNLAGITANTFLSVLEAPMISPLGRPGETSASTAQVRLMVRMQINTVSNIVSAIRGLLAIVPLLNVSLDPIKLGLDVEVSASTGYLDQLDCPRSNINDGMPQAELSSSTGVAHVTLGTFTGNAADAPDLATGPVPLTRLRLSGFLLGSAVIAVNVTEPVTVPVGSNARMALPLTVTEFTRVSGLPDHLMPIYRAEGIPPAAAVTGNPQTVTSDQLLSSAVGGLVDSLNLELGTSGSSGLLSLISGLLGAVLNTLITMISDLIGPVLTGVTGIVDVILDPVLRILGIQLGQATVIMDTVVVDQPHIVSIEVPAP